MCALSDRGTLTNGTEFDSSYKRGKPATFAPSMVIKGWTEAMQYMGEGDKWEIFLPAELAYGDRHRGEHITPGAVLIFELELLKVNGEIADGSAKPRPGPPPPPPPPPPAHVAIGSRVQVDGLTAKPQYNGLLGIVVSWDGAKGRCGVKLDSGEGGAGLMLKPCNLLESHAPRRSPFIMFLHGLGDTGSAWTMLRDHLRLSSAVRYQFPDAPVQPVSANGGHRMTSWMDLTNMPIKHGDPDDAAGLSASCQRIHALLDAEVNAGTPSTDIVLGGFSQGGGTHTSGGRTLGLATPPWCNVPQCRRSPERCRLRHGSTPAVLAACALVFSYVCARARRRLLLRSIGSAGGIHVLQASGRCCLLLGMGCTRIRLRGPCGEWC